MHPTVKPVRLVADAILDASRRGDAVLDGFAGSGTTLLAAERTGRVGYGLEIESRATSTLRSCAGSRPTQDSRLVHVETGADLRRGRVGPGLRRLRPWKRSASFPRTAHGTAEESSP